MTNQYDEDYFERGEATGKSLYTSYRWLGPMTMTMVRRISEHLGVDKADRVLDFGCSKGFVVRAFLEQGFDAYGVDISEYAIANCDEKVKDRVALASPITHNLIGHDWILAKDVMEHLSEADVVEQLKGFASSARKGVFLVVPLSEEIDGTYVVPDYEKDITHKIRWPMLAWVGAIEETFGAGWSVQFQYRLEGVKNNYAQWAKGNGFITVRKLPRLQEEQW